MCRAAEKAMQSAAADGSLPVLLVNANRSGEPFVCELSMSKKKHPKLGWSYHAGVLRDVSGAISVERVLRSAQNDEAYERLCSEWGHSAKAPSGCGDDLALTDELHSVAEAMWKDELSKGIKPNASRKPADADTSSIWSRSTASTLASRSSEPKPESAEKAFHFGALFGGADAGVEHPDQQESEDVARKRTLSGTNDASDTSGAGATFRSGRRRE
mmetsp:Transcript_9999/g.11596  ORF Transcript_9999/g.11596 Transcript_9999/m.11596 type:complete len:215 (+) Transcript_9999:290-934(+)